MAVEVEDERVEQTHGSTMKTLPKTLTYASALSTCIRSLKLWMENLEAKVLIRCLITTTPLNTEFTEVVQCFSFWMCGEWGWGQAIFTTSLNVNYDPGTRTETPRLGVEWKANTKQLWPGQGLVLGLRLNEKQRRKQPNYPLLCGMDLNWSWDHTLQVGITEGETFIL